MLWLIGLLVVIVIIAFTVGGTLSGLGLLLVLFSVTLMTVAYGLRVVPVAHKAQVTRFGKRTSQVRDEGWRIIIPFVQDLLIEDFRFRSEEIELKSLRSKDEAAMFGRVMVTWRPKVSRFQSYVDKGGKEGIRLILNGIVESDMRQYVAKTPWQKVKQSYDDMEQRIRDDIASEIPDIEIKVLSVMDADLVPSTEIFKQADLRAREKLQRDSQMFETDTLIQRALRLKGLAAKDGITIEVDEAFLRFIMKNEAIREGHGRYYEIGAGDAEHLLQAFLASREPKRSSDA